MRETPDRSSVSSIPSFRHVRGLGFVIILAALIAAENRALQVVGGELLIAGSIVFAAGVIGPAIYNRG